MTPTDHSPARTARHDLLVVGAVTLVYFVAATRLELFEKLSRVAAGYERWQIDELPMTLVVLCIGLLWFAWRRARESRRDLDERIRAQGRVSDLLALNRDLAQRLILVHESERRALARELHDEAGQHCTAIRAEASYLRRSRDFAQIEASAMRIDQSAATLNAIFDGILGRLRPPALDGLGLTSALQQLCETWELQTGIGCTFMPRVACETLDDASNVALFRIVQETLTNVAKHAGASHVSVNLGDADGRDAIRLDVRDDGRGLDASVAMRKGFGLVGIQERVAALDGTLRFDSAPGAGVLVRVELPLRGATP